MSRITITIDTDYPCAYRGEPDALTAAVLAAAECGSCVITDSNGNTVGQLTVTEGAPEVATPRAKRPRGALWPRRGREGCKRRVCYCHVDPQPVGYACSSCGCVVVGEEPTHA